MIPKLAFRDDTAHFIRALATYGYGALCASRSTRDIPHPPPPMRYDEDEGEVEIFDDPGYRLACRDYDRQLVLAASESLSPRADDNAVSIAGLSISWPKRMARLKTWGGQQSLELLLRDRLDALLPWAGKKPRKKRASKPKPEDMPADQTPAQAVAEPTQSLEEAPSDSPSRTWQAIPAMDCSAALLGVSGIIPGHAGINTIDMGFSPAGVKIELNPWLEILVLIGMEFAPLAVIPREEFSEGYFAVYGEGRWYPFFRRVRIEPYYYAWDRTDDRGLLPHQFAKLIDPSFSPGPFDDLQIPEHLLAVAQ